MKKQIKNYVLYGFLLLSGMSLMFLSSCTTEEDPEPGEAPIASFQVEVTGQTAVFSNFSQNATSYSWDFGDGNTSTEENPTHTYEADGAFEVTLIASNGSEEATTTKTVNIVPENAILKLLAGDDSKTWILQREGVALGIGPAPASTEWWSFGGVTPLGDRPCILDDMFTFSTDFSFVNNTNGTVFRDSEGNGGWNGDTEGCIDESAEGALTSSTGVDFSAIANGGDYTFEIGENNDMITLNGAGAYIGLPNKTNAGDLGPDNAPASMLEFGIVSYHDGDNVDSLKLSLQVNGEEVYWNYFLVSYANEADMPEIPTPVEVTEVDVTFQLNFNDYAGAATTPELNGTFNGWCGDCNAMTDEDNDGVYQVTVALAVGETVEYKFSADAWTDEETLIEGSSCTVTSDGNTNRVLTVGDANMTLGVVCWNECNNCDPNLTPEKIQGKEWKVINGPGAVRVGPGIGSGEWFTSDQAWIDAAPCLVDDVFSFDASGQLTIDVKEEVFTEGSMTGIEANGCVAVADLPAELTDWAGGTFSYTLTEGTDTALPTIKVEGSGAYIGFYKGANGKELAQPEEGSITYTVLSYIDRSDRDIMEVTIDISEAQDGTAYWTYKLAAAN